MWNGNPQHLSLDSYQLHNHQPSQSQAHNVAVQQHQQAHQQHHGHPGASRASPVHQHQSPVAGANPGTQTGMETSVEPVKNKRGGGRPKDPVWAYFEVTDIGNGDEKATCKACGWSVDKPKAFRMRDHIAACVHVDADSRAEMADIIAQKQDATQAKQEAKAAKGDGETPPDAGIKKRKAETPLRKPVIPSGLKSPITCHVLDATSGKPGNDMGIRLDRLTSNGFVLIANGTTDGDGRCNTLLPGGSKPDVGIYKITFFSNEFYQKRGILSFYPFVEITFEVKEPNEHYHVPLLLSPYAFSTYRGS